MLLKGNNKKKQTKVCNYLKIECLSKQLIVCLKILNMFLTSFTHFACVCLFFFSENLIINVYDIRTKKIYEFT